MGEWRRQEILGFDLETTGVDRFGDVPVSFALVTTRDGAVVRRVSSLVDPGRAIPPEATAVHGITSERARREGMPLAHAVRLVTGALLEAAAAGVPVAGMRLDFDLTIIDAQCRRLDGRGLAEQGWSGPALDAWVLDRHFDRFRPGPRTLVHLCQEYGVAMTGAHEAAADAEASTGVLRAMCGVFPILCHASPAWLHHRQVVWHREWCASYSDWRVANGMTALTAAESAWPIAAPDQPVPAVA